LASIGEWGEKEREWPLGAGHWGQKLMRTSHVCVWPYLVIGMKIKETNKAFQVEKEAKS
jgi:hypothetical protein